MDMKFLLILLASGLVNSAFLTGALQARPLSIYSDGKFDAVIVTGSTPIGSAKYAAEELRDCLKEVTGKDIKIMRADENAPDSLYQFTGNSNAILVGESCYTRKLGINPAGFKPDGFIIKTTPDALVIVGRDDAAFDVDADAAPANAGTLYGVYRWLEGLGCRWFYPGKNGPVIPSLSMIEAKELNIADAPYFKYRMGYGNPQWRRRIGYGGTVDPWATKHTFQQTIDFAKKYLVSHPEYFCVNERGQITGAIALGHPGVADVVAKEAMEYFNAQRHDGKKFFLVIPNDGTFACYCPDCQKQVDLSRGEGGQYSDYIATAVNEVAKKTVLSYPDNPIVFCAYSNYRLPPKNISRLPDNVSVLLAQDRSPLLLENEKKNEEYGLIEDWQKLQPRNIYFCRYYNNWLNKVTPTFVPHWIASDIKNMKLLSESGKSPIGGEMNFGGAGADHPISWWYHLNEYVTAKLLWNPDLDVDGLLNDYYKSFYGPAAEQMKAFCMRVESANHTTAERYIYNVNTVNELEELLTQAKLETRDTAYAKNVAFVDNGFNNIRLLREKLKDSAITPGNSDAELLLHYSFDEGEGDKAFDSVTKREAELKNTRWISGKHDKALHFGDENSFAKFPRVSLKDKDYTVSAWINPDDVTFGKSRYILGADAWERQVFMLKNATVKLQHRLMTPSFSDSIRCIEGGIFDGTKKWFHVAATFSKKNGMALYLNGQLVALNPLQKTPSEFGFCMIGASGKSSAEDIAGSFNGAIDEVKIFGRELSPSEINNEYKENEK